MNLLFDQNISFRIIKKIENVDISIRSGGSAKVIWLHLGNTSREIVAAKLIAEQHRIGEFLMDTESGFLQIS